MAHGVVMGGPVSEGGAMDHPVMIERQVSHRWKIGVKALRHPLATGDGPRWYKLFNLVRDHRADVLAFERNRPRLAC